MAINDDDNNNKADPRIRSIVNEKTNKSVNNKTLSKKIAASRITSANYEADRFREIYKGSEEELLGHSEYESAVNEPSIVKKEYKERLQEIESARRRDLSKSLSVLARRGNIDRQVTHMAQGSEAYLSGAKSGIMSSAYRKEQISSLKEQIEYGTSNLASMAVNGKSDKEIIAASGEISILAKKAAGLERGGKEAALKGLTEDRMIKKADRIEEEHKNSQANSKLKQQAMSGEMGNIDTVTKVYEDSVTAVAAANKKLKDELAEQTKILEDSSRSEEQRQKDLGDVAAKVSTAMKELADVTNKKENAETVKKAVQEAPSLWESKFGSKTKFGKFMRGADAALDIAMDGGAGYKEFAHASEMRKGSATANVIDKTNDLYFKSKQAIMQGDVGAALDVMDSVTAAKYADDQAKHTMLPNFISGAGKAAKGGVGGAVAAGMTAGALMVGTGIGVLPGLAVMGLSATVGGIAGMAANSGGLMDSVNGTAGMNDRLEAYNTMKNLSAADRAVKTDQMQAYYSQGNRLYGAVQGIGGGGGLAYNAATGKGGLQAQLMDPGVLKDLAKTGISADMAAGLVSNFQSAGTFKGEDAVEVMKMAGTAGQKGKLSRDQYTSMASQLMGAGGGAGDLQKTLEFAVAKGMDSSKSIAEMVQASLSMSSDLADMGVSASGATSTALMATVAGLDVAGVDKNLAVRAAQASMQNVNQQMQDRGMSIGNIVETDAIRKAGGTALNAYGAERIGKMGNSEWAMVNAIRVAKSPEEKKAAADAFRGFTNRYGLTSSFFKGKTDELDEQKVGEYEKGSLGFLLNKADQNEKGQHVGQSVMQKIIDAQSGPNKRTLKLEDFTEKERQSLGDELPALIGRTQKMGAAEFDAFKKKYQDQPDLMGAGGEKTKAEASAEIIKLGKEFADKLTESNATAFGKIDALMDMLKKEYVEQPGGKDRSKESGDTGKIVAELTTGASTFKTIMEETAKRVTALGMKVDLPVTANTTLAQPKKK